jgi:hypothetical protein
MNTSALLGFSASILLAAGLTGCAGAAGESGAQSAVNSSTPSPSETPSPTETPAKSYTSDELATLVGQLTDAKGVKLAVMSSTDLTGSAEQVKALLSTMSVEPAVCQEMAISGAAPSVEGATAAMGTSLDAAEGASTAVAMTSGLDPLHLGDVMAQSDQLSKCANMTIGVAGTKVDVALTLLDGVGTVPGTVAYRLTAGSSQ